jgi:hypothetical protein
MVPVSFVEGVGVVKCNTADEGGMRVKAPGVWVGEAA